VGWSIDNGEIEEGNPTPTLPKGEGVRCAIPSPLGRVRVGFLNI